MSSSISYEKCPQCGGAYVIELDCRTLEEYCFCNRCGKTNNFTIVRDKDGKAIMEEEDCRIPKYKNESNDGYGCLAIADMNGVTAIYHYDRPVSVEQIKSEYLNILKEGEGKIKVDKCYLTYWDDEKKEIIALFGKLPRSYDEITEEDEENETIR